MTQMEILEEKYFIGIDLRTTNEKNRAEIEIPKLWQRFHQEEIFDKIPNKKNGNMMALYTDYAKPSIKEGSSVPYTIVVGTEVSTLNDIPKGMVGKKVPAATYAVFECKGKFPESLVKKWKEIWTLPLKRTYTGDFEIYPLNFDPTRHHDVKIYIAVEK